MGTFVPTINHGGWLICLMFFTLASVLVASSAIDLELWIIPVSICWFMTLAGLLFCTVAPLVIDPEVIVSKSILPYASPAQAALALGASAGLGLSMLMLRFKIIKRSYQDVEDEPWPPKPEDVDIPQPDINNRKEILREILFLIPIIIAAALVYFILTRSPLANPWLRLISIAPLAGFFGALWGYFVGCAVVWVTRILGTLAFGKEAMGLGDMHLMGAAGTVLGPLFVIVAFFIAPFFGLSWAIGQMFFKKIRQIPYGPFLSLGIITVIILHDWLLNYFSFMLGKN
jgi:leader peptidase (prepilin peptidase)/N-methyltransferase